MALNSEKELHHKLGQKLNRIRNSKDLTLMDVEAATGIDNSNISKYENSKLNINLSNLYILLKFYEVPFSQFFIDID